MYLILFALFNAVIWAILTIRWKELRKKGIKPLSAFTLITSGLPLWIITFILLSSYHPISLSTQYSWYVLGWVAMVLLSNLAHIYLVKDQALSELKTYSLGFSTLIGLAIDFFLFKTIFGPFTFLGILCFFISGFIISKSKSKKIQGKMFLYSLLLILLMSIAVAIQFWMFKAGLALQQHPLIHGMFTQIIAYCILLPIGFSSLRKDYYNKIVAPLDFVLFGVLTYLFTIFEVYLFKELPITVLLLLTVLQLIIFAGYDVEKKEIIWSYKTGIALLLALAGLLFVSL